MKLVCDDPTTIWDQSIASNTVLKSRRYFPHDIVNQFVSIYHCNAIISALFLVHCVTELLNHLFNLPLNHRCPFPCTSCHQDSLIICFNLPSNHRCPPPHTSCHRALQLVSLCPSSVGAQKSQGAEQS